MLFSLLLLSFSLSLSLAALAPSADTLLVQTHVRDNANKTFREPSGFLKFPYLVPAGPYNEQWDWDSMFMGVALLDYGSLPYFVGTFHNFLSAVNLTNGDLPGCLTPNGPSATLYHAKPLIIQSALLAGRAAGDVKQFLIYAPAMRALLSYWNTSGIRRDSITGLPIWHDQLESGADNLVFSICPSSYSPECWVDSDAFTLIASDAAVWLAREYQAYAAFITAWERLSPLGGGDEGYLFSADYKEEAAFALRESQRLSDALNTYLYGCDDSHNSLGCFYGALNASSRAPIRSRTWTASLPVWANLASNKSVASSALMSTTLSDLSSPFGLRSTSSSDPRYSNQNIINPYSEWRGPVWINAGYLFAISLSKGGSSEFTKKAVLQADALVTTLANDLRLTSAWHESYDSETGNGLAAPGFLSWNTLGARIQDDVAKGIDPFLI
jgi:alpha,alpha-trehalase